MNRINYSWQRIKLMSPNEVGYRMAWKIRKDLIYPVKRHLYSPSIFNAGISIKEAFHEYKLNNPFWFNRLDYSEILRNYVSIFSAEDRKRFDAIIKRAINRTFDVFEIKNYSFGKTINWLKDVKTKRTWPKTYYGKINHNSTKYGAVRYVWELNRFMQLYALGAGYLFTKNENYAEEVISQIESWIKQNPYLMGINWFSQMELAIRLISWSWALYAIKDSKAINEESFGNIIQSIYLQAEIIYRNPSLYSSATNHLIGELSSLVFIGSLFPFLKSAKEWKSHSLRILEKEVERQFYNDGVNKEQSTCYQSLTTDYLLFTYLVAKKEVSKKFVKVMQRSIFFLSEFVDSSGNITFFGDSDQGTITGFNSFNQNFYSLLTTGAILFRNRHLKSMSKYDQKNFWLFGPSSRKIYYSVKSKFNTKSRIYLNGGYAVLRNKGAKLIFDFGALGYLKPAGHGHADALSIVFSISDTPFLIDPGTYLYHDGGDWRPYFKSSFAHNTAVVDNKNQAKYVSHAIWNDIFHTRLIKSQLSEKKDLITANHDAFKKYGVIHTRKIIHDKSHNLFTIKDYFEIFDNKKHDYKLFFHLHPAVKVKEKKNNCLILENKGKIVTVIFDINSKIKFKMGTKKPIFGWYSPSFGIKVKSTAVIVSVRGHELKTLIKY